MTAARHAIVDGTGKVVNVTIVDPQSPSWAPPAGCTLIDSPLCANANIGDSWTGLAFAAGTPPVLPPDPLAADVQRLVDYMPASGSPTAAAITAYLQDVTKPAEIRVTMATLRSLIRVVRAIS